MNNTRPQHRGLMLEEKLLFEQSMQGRCGVDLPSTKNFQNNTGISLRQNIGLPQVSEPQVVRHFVRLSQMNYSIDGGFFPLGSCTMKHNPRLNEKLARLDGFANIHPLQPEESTQGALKLIYTLENWLAELCGLPAVTLTPAAGAHGELAGMMVIKKALEEKEHKKGQKRKLVLVPDSAHGTNPATAKTCGYDVHTIPSAADGRINITALKEAILQHGQNIAAFMVTNPNTCGLFEYNTLEIANLLHNVGAYFYCDGANFNAIVGKARPGDLGVDVMQFNLHKTFSTPHGGGGPGCGPIAVRSELEKFLPIPRVIKKDETYHFKTDNPQSIGRLKAFHGHFGMMVRALSYMMSHGKNGLKQVAEDAVLNANYLLKNLEEHFHTPFEGPCMHECLLSDKIQKEHGITTTDIAKGLIEYGFHPMTVYFPLIVKGAMLIEPTESEPKEVLDEFIMTMHHLANLIKNEDGQTLLKALPASTPRRRLDETQAARRPTLRYKK